MKLFLKIMAGVILLLLYLILSSVTAAMIASASSPLAILGFLIYAAANVAGAIGLWKLYQKYSFKWHRHSDGTYHSFKEE